MTERTWYAEATVAAMREMLRKEFTIFGICGIDPLRFVGESGGVCTFKTSCGNDEMVFRVTPDMEYSVQYKPRQRRKRLL
jgi:hypothetical protein